MARDLDDLLDDSSTPRWKRVGAFEVLDTVEAFVVLCQQPILAHPDVHGLVRYSDGVVCELRGKYENLRASMPTIIRERPSTMKILDLDEDAIPPEPEPVPTTPPERPKAPPRTWPLISIPVRPPKS